MERYGEPLAAEVRQRLDYELGVISDMGFSDYFLVVWDLIRHAREQGIRVGPGRGSAAGCCVAYCLRIVDLDPIRYRLLFERFLNPGRKQMPDIDMDFDERYRGEMIRYAAERYGWDRVAQIVTFSTIKARAAVRDAARVLGYPYSVGDRIAKAMPPLVMGRDTPLWACFEEDPKYADGYKAALELRQMCATDPDAARVVDVARGLEGLRRQDGIHAAAVVISGDPLTEHLPIQRKPEPGGRAEDAPIVTQYEMHGVEELGLLKMDFLGLRNLSVIERALDLIEAATGERPDIDRVALDDQPDLRAAAAGRHRRHLPVRGWGDAQPGAGPGPHRVRGRGRPRSPSTGPGPWRPTCTTTTPTARTAASRSPTSTPTWQEVLGDTYGLCIYQEQMMLLAQKFAGYSLAEADNLRKAAGKKVREIMAQEREKFEAGCETTGYGRVIGKMLFDIIEPFADYGFNRSHAFGYGLVSYQTAWLKAHYPAEYLAALLTSVKDDKDKTGGVPGRVPGPWASRCSSPTSTCRARSSRRSSRPARIRRPRPGRSSPSACRPSATSAKAWWSGSSPSGLGPAPSPTSTTSVPGSTPWSSTSAPSSRSSRPAPSTLSAIPARACAWCSSRSSTGPWPAGVRPTRES